MKKTSLFILVTTALILSGCALLMGTSMRPIVLGKMMIYFRATTSKIYIATEMPEKLEIDTPFDANGQFYYKDAVHDTTLSMATVTLQAADLKMLFFLFSYSKASRNNPEIFPNDISDSLKTLRPFVAFDKYFGESSDNDLTSIIYNSEAHYAYKCVTRKTIYGHNGCISQKSAKFNSLSHSLSDNGNKSYCSSLLVDHSDRHLVSDDT